jgi:hypothetical protein
MAHFAHINDNNIVDNVIVAEQDFIDILPDSQNWIQTSYNTKGGVHYDPETGEPSGREALRGNYAGVGYVYDRDNDVFYPPSPYPSWVISSSCWKWEPPVPYPSDGNKYTWDEDNLNWEPLN